MTELTPELIAELRRLERDATPREWSSFHDELLAEEGPLLIRGWAPNSEDERPEFKKTEDARLVVAMRNALPAPLDAAERGLNAEIPYLIPCQEAQLDHLSFVIEMAWGDEAGKQL